MAAVRDTPNLQGLMMHAGDELYSITAYVQVFARFDGAMTLTVEKVAMGAITSVGQIFSLIDDALSLSDVTLTVLKDLGVAVNVASIMLTFYHGVDTINMLVVVFINPSSKNVIKLGRTSSEFVKQVVTLSNYLESLHVIQLSGFGVMLTIAKKTASVAKSCFTIASAVAGTSWGPLNEYLPGYKGTFAKKLQQQGSNNGFAPWVSMGFDQCFRTYFKGPEHEISQAAGDHAVDAVDAVRWEHERDMHVIIFSAAGYVARGSVVDQAELVTVVVRELANIVLNVIALIKAVLKVALPGFAIASGILDLMQLTSVISLSINVLTSMLSLYIANLSSIYAENFADVFKPASELKDIIANIASRAPNLVEYAETAAEYSLETIEA